MSGMTFHKRYHSDAWDGCLTLSLEERGVYSTILDMIYMKGGRVKLDIVYLATVMRSQQRKVTRILHALKDQDKIYFEEDKGELYIRNSRADQEILEAQTKSDKLLKCSARARQKRAVHARNRQNFEEQTETRSHSDGVLSRSIGVPSHSIGVSNEFEKIPSKNEAEKPNENNENENETRSDFLSTSERKTSLYKNKNKNKEKISTVTMEGNARKAADIPFDRDILYRGLNQSVSIPISDRLLRTIENPRTGAGAALVARRRNN